MSDPGIAYRTREELQAHRANDPITNFREKLIEWGVLTEDEAKAVDKDVRSMINQEVQNALNMSDPPNTFDVLYQDIYVRGSEPRQRRGRTVDETYYQG